MLHCLKSISFFFTGSHYQFFQRFAFSLLGISLPSVNQLRYLLKEDFIASNSRFLLHHPTSPKDLPTIPRLKLLFYIIVVRDISLLSLFEKFYIRSLKPNPASLQLLTPPLDPVPCPLLHQLTSSFMLWNILRPFGSKLSPPIFCPTTPPPVLFGCMMGSGSRLPHHHH